MTWLREEAHPDLKGSFTCLGNWYNLYNEKSMKDLDIILNGGVVVLCGKPVKIKGVSGADLKTAKSEIKQAKKKAEKWKRDPALDFLYEQANKQGDWSVKF